MTGESGAEQVVEVGVEGVFGVGGGVVSDEDVGGESVEDGEEGAG